MMEPTIDSELSKIYVQENSLYDLSMIIKQVWPHVQRIAVIIDQYVEEQYQEKINACLSEVDHIVISLPVSEKLKSLQGAEAIYHRLNEEKWTRYDAILAIGGGVIGDLSGFVASTYMRGIPFAQIPTTLLAQVDSSIGGKNALNTPFAKNTIGTFYQPDFVICDSSFLQTLSREDYYSGLMEAVKISFIADETLWEMIQNEAPIDTIIQRAIQNKLAMIGDDVQDKNKRMNLNFGHTLGHAIESLSQYTLPHGLAVGIGMVEILSLAYQAKWIECHDHLDELTQWMKDKQLATTYSYDIDALMDTICHDKKGNKDEVTVILTNHIGTCFQKTVCYEDLYKQLKVNEHAYFNSR